MPFFCKDYCRRTRSLKRKPCKILQGFFNLPTFLIKNRLRGSYTMHLSPSSAFCEPYVFFVDSYGLWTALTNRIKPYKSMFRAVAQFKDVCHQHLCIYINPKKYPLPTLLVVEGQITQTILHGLWCTSLPL